MTDFGLLTLVPVMLVIVMAIITRSSLEPLVVGILAGCVIAYRGDFLNQFIQHLQTALTTRDSGWVIIVCMLYGSLIMMMIRAGGTNAFSTLLLKYVKSRRMALLATLALGLIIFIDDYFHSLSVGAAMKKVTDKFKISRELLAYVIHATSAPLCILLPVSTWSIFISRILENNKLVAEGQGMSGYIHVIPYLALGYVGLTLVFLVSLGWVPIIGKMKQAELRASTGQTIPPDPTHITTDDQDVPVAKKNKILYFIAPIVVLVATTIYFDFDALKGALLANIFTFGLLFFDCALKIPELSESLIKGFSTVLLPLVLLILAFVLKQVNDDLHLVQYVIHHVQPLMSRELFPAIAFMTLATIAFLTSTSWDLYIIAIPIIVPLAQSLEVNVWLGVSTVVCGGAFGSNTGFFSDSTILSASSTNCPTMTHAITQLPYAVISMIMTGVVYLAIGFLS
ncbi:MAG TPA: sodium:proton antiporter [Cytophagales bacterium]|jgi:tetracycline resistance efflux pump|nr:sodium:proton antiporter [Cytophagales bacterium]